MFKHTLWHLFWCTCCEILSLCDGDWQMNSFCHNNFGHCLRWRLNPPTLSIPHSLKPCLQACEFVSMYMFCVLNVCRHCHVPLASAHWMTWLFTPLSISNESEAGCDRPQKSTMHYLANGVVADARVLVLKPSVPVGKDYPLHLNNHLISLWVRSEMLLSADLWAHWAFLVNLLAVNADSWRTDHTTTSVKLRDAFYIPRNCKLYTVLFWLSINIYYHLTSDYIVFYIAGETRKIWIFGIWNTGKIFITKYEIIWSIMKILVAWLWEITRNDSGQLI